MLKLWRVKYTRTPEAHHKVYEVVQAHNEDEAREEVLLGEPDACIIDVVPYRVIGVPIEHTHGVDPDA